MSKLQQPKATGDISWGAERGNAAVIAAPKAVPLKLFTYTRFGKPEKKSEGSVPATKLYDRSSEVSPVNLVIDGGMVPYMLFSERSIWLCRV